MEYLCEAARENRSLKAQWQRESVRRRVALRRTRVCSQPLNPSLNHGSTSMKQSWTRSGVSKITAIQSPLPGYQSLPLSIASLYISSDSG